MSEFPVCLDRDKIKVETCYCGTMYCLYECKNKTFNCDKCSEGLCLLCYSECEYCGLNVCFNCYGKNCFRIWYKEVEKITFQIMDKYNLEINLKDYILSYINNG